MDERINYVSQFISISRFRLTDYEIDKLVAFVEAKEKLNGKSKTSKGIEKKAFSSEGRYDVKEDYVITYVFDTSGVYLLKRKIVYYDGVPAYEDPEVEIRNPREMLTYVDWLLRDLSGE